MLGAQAITLIREVEPPQIRYASRDDFLVDRSIERKAWFDGYGAAYTSNHIIELGNSDPKAYIRMLIVKQGIIADFSHLGIRDWNEFYTKFKRDPLPEGDENDFDKRMLPAIHCVFNEDELAVITPTVEQVCGLPLKGFELLPLLDAIDEAEVVDEEDEDEDVFASEETEDDPDQSEE